MGREIFKTHKSLDPQVVSIATARNDFCQILVISSSHAGCNPVFDVWDSLDKFQGLADHIAINSCDREFVPASGHGAGAPFLSLGSGVDYGLVGINLGHWNFLKSQSAQVSAEEQHQDD